MAEPAELDASKLTKSLVAEKDMRPIPTPTASEVLARRVCTDHMITATYTTPRGWSSPTLIPYAPLSIWPTTSALHYATACFEGMRLYRGHDGKLRLFRPWSNTDRMLRSATRIALPAFDPAALLDLIATLCAVDGPRWLDRDGARGRYLYIRPLMFGSDPSYGVEKPEEAMLVIMLAPQPSVDTGRPRGIGLLASEEGTVRAWPGGHGWAKVGANYGPGLNAQGEARRRGYDTVLWLLERGGALELTEGGASNIFVVWDVDGRTELVTPPIEGGLILEGVTRASILELARERLGREGVEVAEKKLDMREVARAVREDRLKEVFLVGTAVFVSQVGVIGFEGEDWQVPLGEVATRLKGWLKEIMYGDVAHEWALVVND